MISFILNLPYTIIGLVAGLFSFPNEIKFSNRPYTIILNVKKFWWAFGYMKNARAMTIGHTVLMGPNKEDGDLEHEVIHVQQYQKMPVIFPILYYFELFTKGYRKNKYEIEAYDKSDNLYKDHQFTPSPKSRRGTG